MRLPVISSCRESECFYNHDLGCHAPAITVGGSHPRCDTYARGPSDEHIHRGETGRVGACHVTACRHNSEMTCQAASIVVDRHGDHPDCYTYEKRAA